MIHTLQWWWWTVYRIVRRWRRARERGSRRFRRNVRFLHAGGLGWQRWGRCFGGGTLICCSTHTVRGGRRRSLWCRRNTWRVGLDNVLDMIKTGSHCVDPSGILLWLANYGCTTCHSVQSRRKRRAKRQRGLPEWTNLASCNAWSECWETSR